jgi:hypothetical protein
MLEVETCCYLRSEVEKDTFVLGVVGATHTLLQWGIHATLVVRSIDTVL